MTALARLGDVSRAYATAAEAYGPIALAAAEAEATHRREKAKAILRHKATEKMSVAEAETRADADDGVAELYRLRLTTAAVADASRARLNQLKEQTAVGRTYAAQERATDSLHATNGGP